MKKLREVHPNACGIDVGSSFHVAAIGMSDEDVKEFGVYTEHHRQMISWLKSNKVCHIAMEATGSYWQTLFSALQQAGFTVVLVDGKQTKGLRKKTDIQDARAIYQLHKLGLLTPCFLPDEVTLEIRNYYRHRSKIIEESSRLSNRMQQAMRLMNIRLDKVINDIMGKTGRTIISSILEGERNPQVLASLADPRIRRSQSELVSGLQGQWKESQLFILEDCFAAYKRNQERIKMIDSKIEELLKKNIEYEVSESQKITKKKPKKITLI
jgi:transposase